MKALPRFILMSAFGVLGGAAQADKTTRAAGAEVVSACFTKGTGDAGTSWNTCAHVPYADGGWTDPKCHNGKWPGDDAPSIMRGKALQLWKAAEKP